MHSAWPERSAGNRADTQVREIRRRVAAEVWGKSVRLSRCARLIVLVKSAKAAARVMASLVRYCEGRLKLVVNRAKSKCTELKSCEFLGYALDRKRRLVWTPKALHRFKQRAREITRRNRGHRVQDVIGELRSYVVGWLNYYRLSCTYKQGVPDVRVV